MIALPYATKILDLEEFKKLTGPGVYIAHGDDAVLYVGSSKNLLRRFSSSQHLGMAKSIPEMKSLELRFTDTEEEARELEKSLLVDLKPRYKNLSSPWWSPRLSLSARKILDALGTKLGISRDAVLELALQQMAREYEVVFHDSQNEPCETIRGTNDEEALGDLQEGLAFSQKDGSRT